MEIENLQHSSHIPPFVTFLVTVLAPYNVMWPITPQRHYLTLSINVYCQLNPPAKSPLYAARLHSVSCAQKGRQREPSVKTLFSPLSAEFWRHCVAFALRPKRRNRSINFKNILFPRVGIEPTTSRVYCHTLCPCATTGLKYN